MYNRNVPAVPELHSDTVIEKIVTNIGEIDDDERREIEEIVLAFSCSPITVAEKISYLLQVDYHRIFQLL